MLCFDLKLLLYFFNGALLFFAVILISSGFYCSKFPGPLPTGSLPAIIIGVFICCLVVLGILTLRIHNFALSLIYFILIIIVLGGQAGFGIKALAANETVIIDNFLHESYAAKSKDRIDSNILEFQKFYKCCGYSGPNGKDVTLTDKIYISKGNDKPTLQNATFQIPECCQSQAILCTKLEAYQDSCVKKMNEAHKEWTHMLGTFLVISFVVLFTAGVLSVQELYSR